LAGLSLDNPAFLWLFDFALRDAFGL